MLVKLDGTTALPTLAGPLGADARDACRNGGLINAGAADAHDACHGGLINACWTAAAADAGRTLPTLAGRLGRLMLAMLAGLVVGPTKLAGPLADARDACRGRWTYQCFLDRCGG